MQIQRIQSLLLLLAGVLTAVFIFVPFGSLILDKDGMQFIVELTAANIYAVLCPAGIAAVLLLLDIFLYKNLRLQKQVLIIGIMMLIVSIGIVIYVNFDHATQGTIHWGGGGLLLVAALIGAVAALRCINHDQRLLASYDRLR